MLLSASTWDGSKDIEDGLTAKSVCCVIDKESFLKGGEAGLLELF